MTCECASAEELAVCLDHNIVRLDGVNRRVYPQGAELAFFLAKHRGTLVPYRRIDRAIWGVDPPASARECINSIKFTLVRQHKGTRLKITGQMGRHARGLHLTLAPLPPSS